MIEEHPFGVMGVMFDYWNSLRGESMYKYIALHIHEWQT